MIVAIDPGIKRCAYASFDGERLARAAFEAPPWRVDLVLVERPEYHGARSNAARTQDLMALSWAGAVAAYRLGAQVKEYGASEWNRGAPKPIVHKKLWRALEEPERVLLGGSETLKRIDAAVEKGAVARWRTGRKGAHWYPASFAAHNLLDAAAIGCAHLGRISL